MSTGIGKLIEARKQRWRVLALSIQETGQQNFCESCKISLLALNIFISTYTKKIDKTVSKNIWKNT